MRRAYQNAVALDRTRIQQVAQIIAQLPEDNSGLNFYSFNTPTGEIIASDMYPDLDDPCATDFFFFGVLHEHGFWYGDSEGYQYPLIGTVNKKGGIKGSDLLWKSLRRLFTLEPRIVTKDWLLPLTPQKFANIFSDDNGPIPFPDWEARYRVTDAYAKHMQKKGLTPIDIIESANKSGAPLLQFRRTMKLIPGFNEDHYEKKTLLLAMILSSRPEKFLDIRDPEHWLPIVDYHLMRLSLRTGMIVVPDKILKARLENREWINADEEEYVRQKTFEAMRMVLSLSGRSLSVVDNAFWQGRKFCPEMEKPNCGKCIFRTACAQKTEMFQPVFRTLNY